MVSSVRLCLSNHLVVLVAPWVHGPHDCFADFPPHKHDIMQLPVGKTKWVEINCDKGGTSYWRTSAGSTYTQKKGSGENDPCPGYPMSQYRALP
jgi:hypothetical protein